MTNPVTPTGSPAPSGGGMPKWLIILLVVLLVVVIGCCGGVATCFWWVKNKAPGFVKEKMREQGVELNLPDATGTAAMPSNFPADVPAYTGAKTVASTAQLKTDSGEATLTTSDPAATVKDFYDKQMTDNGWKQDAATSAGDQTTTTYSKADHVASVQVNGGPKATTILIIYGKK